MKPETKSLLIRLAIAAYVSILVMGILLLVVIPTMINIPPLTPDQFDDASGPMPLSGLVACIILIIVTLAIIAMIKPYMPNEYDDMEPKKK